VLGQVNSPGLVRWHCGMRAVDAVREAGGFNALASPRKTRVLREQRRVEAGESLYLLPGDVVTAHALCDGY
jgi:protein involved in polysaccharide export with SLBB domain